VFYFLFIQIPCLLFPLHRCPDEAKIPLTLARQLNSRQQKTGALGLLETRLSLQFLQQAAFELTRAHSSTKISSINCSVEGKGHWANVSLYLILQLESGYQHQIISL
jgi:hypothetical protein